MAYEVRKISHRKSMNDFLNLPYLIYQGDSNWVAPIRGEIRRILDPVKNPYFKKASLQLFNCYKNNKICSRIAVIINRHYQRKFGKKTAFFGFFESINDARAIDHLFHTVEKYCNALQIETIEGPFNPNHYSELGLLTNQFSSEPTFFQSYNPDYYGRLLEYIGFHVSAKFHTRKNEHIRDHIKQRFPDHNGPTSEEFKLRAFNYRDKATELERLRSVMNDAFSENWHFLPLSQAEYKFSARYLSLVTPPELIQFVEYRGDPVGAVHFALDINPLLKKFKGYSNPFKYLSFRYNRRNIYKLIIFAVGIRKAFRNSQALHLLSRVTADIASKYEVLETTWTSSDNTSAMKAAEKFGLQPDKEFAIYEKRLIPLTQV